MAGKTDKSKATKGPVGYEEAVRQIDAEEIKPVYLLYGEEDFLQERLIAVLRDAWLRDDADSAGLSREDGRAMSQSRAVDLAGQMGLFSERKLVVIDEPAFIPCGKEQGRGGAGGSEEEEAEEASGEEAETPGAKETGSAGKGRSAATETQPLLAHLDKPLALSCLVLRCRKGKPDRRNKLVAGIAASGGLVEASLLSPAERLPFLREAMEKAGKQCLRRQMEQIARQPGGLVFGLRELEKVVAYAGEESTITPDMLDAVLTVSLEANIFRLVDDLGQRRQADALRELRRLLDGGESPFAVFAMMLRQYRLIFKAKACLQDGVGRGRLAQAMGVQPFVAEKAAGQSRQYTFVELERAMRLFLDKDLAMKSGASHARVLEDLVIELAPHI